MLRKIVRIIELACVSVAFTLLGACTTLPTPQAAPVVIQPPPVFPPQAVLKSGDYPGFLAENQKLLKTCQEPEQCSAALFNLGFLYSYSKSPYHNPKKGAQYLEDLIRGAPESPWAYEAMLWLDLMKKPVVRKKPKKRDAREEPQPAEAAAPEVDDLVKTVGATQMDDWEAERQHLEDEIKVKDDIIRELNRQIERSRQIDIDIQKKERGLLY